MGGAVRSGLEVLASERSALVRGRKIGLLSHAAAVDGGYRPAWACLVGAGAELVRLFAPEHGVAAGLQDMEASTERRDPLSGLPVVSLYGADESSLTPPLEAFEGLDALVIDLVDVGARYYTFVATAVRCLEPAARAGVQVIVCDRPNPLGGVAFEGNAVAAAQRSFVGELSVPNRHGLTLAELCLLTRQRAGLDVALELVRAEGWERSAFWDETGLPWVQPSPNMPTLDTAIVYPGACLLEGTLLSEGRGTTRPFELWGAPWLHPERLAERLDGYGLPGVAFRPLVFRPTFHKHAGLDCGGVQIHVTERAAFRPVLTGVALLTGARAENPELFAWRTEEYEFVDDQPAIDLLAGTPLWRQMIEAGEGPWELAKTWQEAEREFQEERAGLLLY